MCNTLGQQGATLRGKRLAIALVVAAASLALVGCAARSGVGSPSPTPSSPKGPLAPHARTYATLQVLWQQVAACRTPSPEITHVNSSPVRLPSATQLANVLVASPRGLLTLSTGVAATNVHSALFPGTPPEAECARYAALLGGTVERQTMYQLTGPNWVIWSFELAPLQDLRLAIGGDITRVSVATAGA